MKTKYALLVIIFLMVSNMNAQTDIDSLNTEEVTFLNWQPNYKETLKKSKKEKKPILIYFTGSDWCGPCKALDKRLFHTDKFKSLADKDLLLYEADSPRNKDLISPERLEVTNDLKRKYKVRSFPTLVFVNHKGKVLGYKKGLILTEYYYPYIQSVIDNY